MGKDGEVVQNKRKKNTERKKVKQRKGTSVLKYYIFRQTYFANTTSGDFWFRNMADASPFYTEEVFSSPEQLTDWVQNIARGIGFVIVKRRTKSEKGYLYEINYGCSKGRKYEREGLEDKIQRQTSTSKTDCPFKLVAKYSKTQNFWRLRVKCDRHNHDFAESLHGFPYAMRLKDDEFSLVQQLTEYHVPPRHILSSIKERNSDNVSSVRTIYNAQNKIRGAIIGDRTPIQVLSSHLMRLGYTYYPRVNEVTDELEELFFVHPTSYALWCTFPEIMLMDSTYNTTLFKLPFFEIVGVTSTNKTFSMAFCFLNKEKGPNFQWVLQCVKEVIDEEYYPRVIITDRDLALVGACREEFPNSNKLLCRWHISQNVLQYCRNRCSTLKEYESIKGTWDWMVKAPTRAIFTHYYEHLQQLLVEHADIFSYLNNWLQGYSDMFLSFITDQYRNYGESTTCRVESQHALLKLYLGTTQSNLDTLLSSIDKIIIAQETAIKETFNRSKNEKMHKCNIPLFAELWYKVSNYALELIFEELQRSITPEECGHQLRSIYGLPCFHELLYYRIHKMAIPLERIDIFWRTLAVPWPSISTPTPEDGPSCETDIRQFKNIFGKMSSFVKKNMLKKVRGIYDPESVDIREPAVHKSTRGRPSTKDKKSQATKVPDLNKEPTVNHRRSTNSRSTKVPNLNKEPARHSSYMGPRVEQSRRHKLYVRDGVSEYLMEQIPELFHRYIISIYNVLGDGNCGFRCVAVGIGYQEDRWSEIRALLIQELDTHRDYYTGMWWYDGFNHIRSSVEWFRPGFAPRAYWMSMPNTGLVIASLINRPVVSISPQQSFTCFPLLSGPDLSEESGPLVIARVGDDDCAHYIYVTLDENSPLPNTHPQWGAYRLPNASAWETLYSNRQRMYTEIIENIRAQT